MVALYLTSQQRGSGKTTIGAGLAKHLLNDGKKVGFLRPAITGSNNSPAEAAKKDAAVMKELLALAEPVESLCPVFDNEGSLKNGIKAAYEKVSRDKDVVIVESQASRSIAEALDAKVILVASYCSDLPKTVDSYKDFGKSLLGIVLNKVPKNRAEQARNEIAAPLAQAGIDILGTLPEDRTLLSLTVGELAENIQGKIITGAEKSAELVENVMLGALAVDPGPLYFGRKANKVAVLRAERPDMQLAALETQTKCLVLAGDAAPKPAILYQAEEKGTCIISAEDDVSTIVTNIEAALSKAGFNQSKLPKASELMEQYFNFGKVYKELGLTS